MIIDDTSNDASIQDLYSKISSLQAQVDSNVDGIQALPQDYKLLAVQTIWEQCNESGHDITTGG